MPNRQKLDPPVHGKTYSLFSTDESREGYFIEIKRLADLFLQRCSDARKLLSLIQKAGKKRYLVGLKISRDERQLLDFVRETLRQSMSVYTQKVAEHLRTLPLSRRTDPTLTTTEEQYHLYMLEIELVNRLYRQEFKQAEFKFALLAHCLPRLPAGLRLGPG